MAKMIKKAQKGAMLKQAPKTTLEKISSTKLKDVPEKAKNLSKKLIPEPKKKTGMDALKALGEYVSTFGYATEGYNPAPNKGAKKTMPKKNMKNGGSLSALSASNKRDKGTDVGGAWTKVQKKTLAGAKGKASLTKDKQLGATKMAKRGMKIAKKK